MKSRTPGSILLVLIAALVFAASPASATRYLYHDLGVLGSNLYSSATDVNNAGQVVGSSWSASSWPYDTVAVTTTYSLLGGVGTMTSLGKLEGATYSQGGRITEDGQIMGQSEVSNAAAPGGYLPRGVYWSSPTATITNIGTLVGPPPDTTGFGSFAWDVNQSGQVSGTSYTGPWNNFVTNHAISWSGGVMTNLGTYLGTTPQAGVAANAMGINDAGQTTGWTNTSYQSPAVPFVRSAAGLWTLLPLLPGATEGYGREISESGTKIVGNVTMSDGKQRGVLWTYNGTQWSAQDLGTVGGSVSGAKDLNEVTGQILGYGTDAGGLNRALIVEPGDTAFQDLTALTDGLPGGVYLSYATGLNDWSWIVGADSQGHAYLLAPNAVPIPGAVLLFGSGLAGLASWRRFRKG